MQLRRRQPGAARDLVRHLARDVDVTARAVSWAGWVLVPYALWLRVATSLAVGYWRLVPRPTSARSS